MRNSTKIERIVAEQLRYNHIPFEQSVVIGGREVDFVIADKIILEVDGILHKDPDIQKRDAKKSKMLSDIGYRIFLRYSAKELRESTNNLINLVKRIL